jgi:hypothetical protein
MQMVKDFLIHMPRCCCCCLQSRRSPAEAAALAFAESKLACAAALAKEQGRSFAPELFFLQGAA